VTLLQRVLQGGRFASLLYLSSTRIYRGAASTREGEALVANPAEPDDLYNLSKMMGESLCLAVGGPTVRVARLSNVYGPDLTSENFLTSIVRDALRDGRVVLRSAPDSEKDYVSLADVVAWLPLIAVEGRERLYNVAGGGNTTHEAITRRLAALTGCAIEYAPGSPRVTFPPIDVRRIRDEFGRDPRSVVDDLAEVVAAFRADQTLSPRTS
jgi:nucleoside-diphosphate-sugar epimerase